MGETSPPYVILSSRYPILCQVASPIQQHLHKYFKHCQAMSQHGSTGPEQCHYSYVIVDTMVPQITSLNIVFSTVYSDVDQRKHQRSVSLALCGVTGEFPAQMTNNAENVSIWWRHHVLYQVGCICSPNHGALRCIQDYITSHFSIFIKMKRLSQTEKSTVSFHKSSAWLSKS